MRDRFTAPTFDRNEVLDEFVADINDFQTLLPETSELLLLGAGSVNFKAGLFAVATDRRPPGIEVGYSAKTPADVATALEYRGRYDEMVGGIQKLEAAQLDDWSAGFIYKAGRNLLEERKRIVGAFVLLEAAKPRRPSGENSSYIGTFVSNALVETVGQAFREVFANENEEGGVVTEADRQVLVSDQSHARYASRAMAGLFPSPRKVHKVLGLRRSQLRQPPRITNEHTGQQN
jgi:hypothetical protein